MVGRHDLLHQLGDGLLILIGRVHQLLQLHKEFICIKGNGVTDMDQIIIGFLHTLLSHQLFFVQLLTGPQTNLHDVDIFIGHQSAEADHFFRQIQDLHRTQGPLMMLLNLSGVTISTAGSNFDLSTLTTAEADRMLDELEQYLEARIEEQKNEEI